MSPFKNRSAGPLAADAPRQLRRNPLDHDHPLTRASEAVEIAARQWRAVAAMVVGSGTAIAEGAHWARTLAVAAAIVLVGLSALLAARIRTRRDRALDLIADGHERIPLAVVERELRRVGAPRTRSTLARTLESLIEETVNRRVGFARSARPPLDAPLVAVTAAEIRTVASLLRSGHVSVGSVARAERLVTRGDSPLYGQDVVALRDELRRIGYR